MNIFRIITTPVYLASSLEFLDTVIMEHQSIKYYQILESPESFGSSQPSGIGTELLLQLVNTLPETCHWQFEFRSVNQITLKQSVVTCITRQIADNCEWLVSGSGESVVAYNVTISTALRKR